MAVGLSQRYIAGNGSEGSKQHLNESSPSPGMVTENVCSLCLSPSSSCFTDQSDTAAVLMPKKTALGDKEMGDIFFGADDVNCVKDFLFMEDVIECMVMESAMKSFKRRRRNGWLSITECFEFLKLICCIRF
ncbi:hypothetical protein FNV43_RR24254 [Rhamnella rubrinervis]|uniref:Uncharacterized protein n=1 Tax=Rhamnella rubrinervis TaxID=2594499 RepID=A0A8K0GL14_9ROSA|nr:hypothetical protein FNV43_RR24254 [Rhamnella rubrinervis]